MPYDTVAIRCARPGDAARLAEIYAPYVRETAITFEYDVPTADEFRGRMEETLKRYPFLVAEVAGKIAGYAYLGPFKERAAYDWCAETSIYVDGTLRRRGLGRLLYESIEDAAREMGLINLNACIGFPPVEDEHLTRDSVEFHERLGYRWVGQFHNCGYKFGRWYDMVWMEKDIADHPAHPEPVRPFPEVRDIVLEKYGIG